MPETGRTQPAITSREPQQAGSEMRRIYAVMTATSVTTFMALTTIYQLFFTRQLFA